MRHQPRLARICAVCIVLLVLLVPAASALAVVGDGNAAFDAVWATTDQAVAERQRQLLVVLGTAG